MFDKDDGIVTSDQFAVRTLRYNNGTLSQITIRHEFRRIPDVTFPVSRIVNAEEVNYSD